jgi:hypothetical protein
MHGTGRSSSGGVRGGEACWKYEKRATEDIQYWIYLTRLRMEERMGVKV